MPDAEHGFVHRWVPGSAPGAPVLLLLHGTGGDENDLIPLGQRLWPGAALLSPRGQVLEGSAPRFFRRIAEGVFDLDDLARRTDDLAAFVREAATRYGFRIENVTALGYSNGANIAASVLLRHPGLLRRAVLLRAMLPFEPQPLPDLGGTAVYLGSGLADTVIPRRAVERLAAVLHQAGAQLTHAWQPAGHGLTQEDLARVEAWLGAARG